MIKADAYFPYRRMFGLFALGLSLLLGGFFILGLLVGTVPLGKLFHLQADAHRAADFIIRLRFNREIAAIFCGGMLAMGSAMLQALTRNAMVAPDLTGLTSLGCLLIVVCEILWLKSPVMNVVMGTAGAMLGFILCFSFTKNQQSSNRLGVILAGISISFTATAFLQLLILNAPQDLDDYLHFLTGTLYAINDETVTLIIMMALVALPAALMLSKYFNVLTLDDQTCHSIGVPMKRYRVYCFMTASVLIGTSVIGVGNMGFLGIVAPNLARILVGNRPRYVFVLSFLVGALMYLLADTLGRCLISPAEIPAGLMTNMMSAPLFLYILFRYFRGQYEWN
ncbi:FecCD family ABC transporter permease [Aquicella lusitana]|nr:iron ABC transporter permease [Aquicella lusitana]